MSEFTKVVSADLLQGKNGLIIGVANNKSIAWGIAKACRANGANLMFSYQGEVLKKRVKPLAESLDSHKIYECDVQNEESITQLFKSIQKDLNGKKLDFIVHAVAFSDKNELKGAYTNTSRQNFLKTMDISCYSLTNIIQTAEDLSILNEGGSVLTLSYYGAEKYIPHYNVMGVAKAALESSVQYLAEALGKKRKIRVNAISAGPIKTLAASGIGDMKKILTWYEANSPMRRNITIEEVGNTSLFLLSDLSTAVTGSIIHCDGGYHVMGMCAYDGSEDNENED